MNPTFLSYPDLEDPRTQYFLCSLIQAFRLSTSPAAAVQLFRTQYAPPFVYQYLGIQGEYTGTLVIKWDDVVLWLAEGTTELTHVPNMVNGWTFFRGGADQLGLSDAFKTASAGLLRDLRPEFWQARYRHIMAGHSFGGAQLHAVAVTLARAFPGLSPRGFSYGSPRPGGTLFQQLSVNTAWTRWFTASDPVPQVPPHVNEAPLLHLGTGLVLTVGANQQVQPPLGKRINADATITVQETSDFPLVVPDISLLSWITGVNCMSSQDHRLSVYMDRFSAMQATSQTTLRPRTAPPVLEVPDNQPRVVQQRQIVEAVRVAVAAGPVPRPNAVLTQPPALPGTRYRVKRFEGIHYVTFADQAYGIGPGKRAARKLARAWNLQIARGEAKPPVAWNPQPVAG